MPWRLGDLPGVARQPRAPAEGRERPQLRAGVAADGLRHGPGGGEVAPGHAGRAGEMQRLLDEAMDAGACGFSLQRLGEHSLQADFDGTPMPTDCMADEDVLALAEVLRDRDEGFIQITQAQAGDPTILAIERESRDRDGLHRAAGRDAGAAPGAAQRPGGAVDERAADVLNEMAWVRTVQREGPAHLRPGRSASARGSTSRWSTGTSTTPAPPGTRPRRVRSRRRCCKLADPDVRAAMKREQN